MYVNIIIYINKLLLFVWSALKKGKENRSQTFEPHPPFFIHFSKAMMSLKE